MTDRVDPFSLTAPAARGDLGAQRQLRDMAYAAAIAPAEDDPATDAVLIHEALIFARLAASHGEQVDEGALVSMLSVAGGLCTERGLSHLAADLGAEAVAWVSTWADRGVPIADERLNGLIEATDPAIVEAAQRYKRRMKAC